ncbi:MAG: TIGR03000 domain-containing protein, partial [Gemmataceae bacterium]|nr:TIGR03000 domain-containing protein [Gemmataceae bacterium]
PRVAPAWGYHGLPAGPYVGYAYPFRSPFVAYDQLSPRVGVVTGVGPGFGVGPGLGYGVGYPFGYPFFAYPNRIGNQWSNGLSAYGPPVPVYGPIPGVFGNSDLVRNWRAHPGIAYTSIGIYTAFPRARHPGVSVWPTAEPLYGSTPVAPPAPGRNGGCLVISVRVPQPGAEVFVDGQKTAQTGTDRMFESPPLEAGKAYRYTVTAKWIERGQTVESTREVTGTPGEVVRVNFGGPAEVIRAGR